MSQSKEEYRSHYARLAKEFATLPRVVVRIPQSDAEEIVSLGELQILDLRQDSGYGAGVMLDETADGEKFKFFVQRAEYVHLFSAFEDQLMQFIRQGPVWDGNLISKDQTKVLKRLGLVQKCEGGWTIVTPAGVAEAVKLGWLRA